MGGIRFMRLLVTTMMLLMLFLIVLNAYITLPPSLPPSLAPTNLLSTPNHEQEIIFDNGCFWFWAPRCLRFRSYKLYTEPKHSVYNDCIHKMKIMCRMHS
jgi:hypothetical protein